MFKANFWCYVWDLEDEGIDAVLDRLHGEVGATGISVAVSYPSVTHRRVHDRVSSRLYTSDAGLYFQPDTKRYASTRLRPVVASYLKSRNPLARIAEAADRRGMDLQSWTVCAPNSALAARHPEMAVRDVFGELHPSWLCPINPDVAEYFRALVDDLSANYGIERIELDSPFFPTARHAPPHLKVGIPFGAADQLLLNLCFCPSCRQTAASAGVDVDAAIRSATVRLESVFRSGQPSEASVDDLLAEDEPLRQWCGWRTRSLTELIASMAKRSAVGLALYVSEDAESTGANLSALAHHVQALLGLCYHSELSRVDSTAHRLIEIDDQPVSYELGFHAYAPVCPDAPTLVRQLTRAAELGVRSVNLYHYGIMPETNLNWARQALRSARRVAS